MTKKDYIMLAKIINLSMSLEYPRMLYADIFIDSLIHELKKDNINFNADKFKQVLIIKK